MINKRVIVILLLIVAGLCSSLSGAGPVQPAGNQKINFPRSGMNILLITVDTLRYDHLSVLYDKYVKTPNIDRLASQSIVFTRAFSHNPCTLPAHTNIMTGTTALYHGISDNSGFYLDKRFLTLASYLKQSGYLTGAFIGAFPLDSRFGLNQGFDVYDDQYGTHNKDELFFVERPAEKVIEPAIKWISGTRGKWFTWIHLFDPHQPYMPPQPFRKDYRNDLYSGEVAYMDSCLKKLFDFLENRKLMSNTLIIFTADHGEALGEKGEETHTYFAYNNTIHIPLLIYIPGARPGFIHENVAHADIFPTVCEMIGMKIPSQIQGESLFPVIESGKRKRNTIYFESLTAYLNRGWAPLRGFIRGDTKFIDLPIVEVYNIKNDLNENFNIAGKSKVQQMKRDMVKLKIDLKGPSTTRRSGQADSEVDAKLKSLGYITGSGAAPVNKVFTAADDLKTMLPIQNRMLNALAKYQDGRSREAIDTLLAVAKESPAFTLVYQHLSTIYQDLGRMDKAVSILEDGLKKNPGNTSLMSSLGILHAESNNPERAVELLLYCTRVEPDNPDNFNYLGVAYFRKRDFARALDNYKKVISMSSNYAPAFNNIGTLYLTIFTKQKDETSYKLAIENFSRAIEIDPRLYSAYNGKGAAYMFKKDYNNAVIQYKKALELKPDFIDVYYNIGIAFQSKGDRSSALNYYRQCKEKYYDRLSLAEQKRLDNLINEVR